MYKDVRKLVENNKVSFSEKLSLRKRFKRDYPEIYSLFVNLDLTENVKILELHYILRQLLIYYLKEKDNQLNQLQDLLKKNKKNPFKIKSEITNSKDLNCQVKLLSYQVDENIVFHFKKVKTIFNHYMDRDLPYYELNKYDANIIKDKLVRNLGDKIKSIKGPRGGYLWVTKDDLINQLKNNGNNFTEIFYNLGLDRTLGLDNEPFVSIGIPGPLLWLFCPTIFIDSGEYFRPKYRKDNWGETLNSKNLNPGFSESIVKELNFPKQNYQDLVMVGYVSADEIDVKKRAKDLLIKSLEDIIEWNILN